MSETKTEEKKTEVAKGVILKPKETIFGKIYHLFFAMEPKDVVKIVIEKVIIPDIRYSMNNVWRRSGDVLFYGPEAATKNNARSKTNYNVISSAKGERKAFQNESSTQGTTVNEFKTWAYTNKEDVEKVLLDLEEDLNNYETVTVGRFLEILNEHELLDEPPQHVHFEWGWTKDDEFDYEIGHDGLWHIIFPKLKRV